MRRFKKLVIKKFKKANRRKKTILSFWLIFFVLISVFQFYKNQDKIKILNGLAQENVDKIELEKKIYQMVRGYPIEEMIPYIIKTDSVVASFLVSIAKKESDWGKRRPILNGEDCYNYWGYRGVRERMGSGGHTCFDNPQDAVETVAKRIHYLVYEAKKNTPKKMIYWKCGSSCVGHSNYGIQKWISDVDFYFKKIIN